MLQKLKIQQLLQKYNVTPNKVLGQNFLLDEATIISLIDAANVEENDVVVEVGPGTGAITKELAKRANRVLAVEKDPNMANILKNELAKYKNIEIINEDILNFQITNNKSQIANKSQNSNSKRTINGRPTDNNYKLIGAPPYYLTARLFRHFLEGLPGTEATGAEPLLPKVIAVVIQKEVAEKICAKPPNMNLLALSVQLYGEPKIIKKVPKNFFWPRPNVDSTILIVGKIKIPERLKSDFNRSGERMFFKVARAGFSSPRKQLINNLSQNLKIPRIKTEKILKKCGIQPEKRAEMLTIEDWKKLTRALS